MRFKIFKNTVLLWLLVSVSCGNSESKHLTYYATNSYESKTSEIIVAANKTEVYMPLLEDKRIAVVANQTSVIFKDSSKGNTHTHLVDSLLNRQIGVKKVFAPEHGFRGTADAGETIKDGFDTKTGLPIISLYGKNKKPKRTQLEDIDIILFDIQDVGARFYTYISTLHYVMQACAEASIPLIVLDRPNPNGHYVDGPVLEIAHKSFVGLHPVPVVHGLTIGEYAKMINGEGWLSQTLNCNLKVIPLSNYSHDKTYDLPIRPSPNLPNAKAINLYPSLCFFEGTTVSVGRGTLHQFQVIGTPFFDLKQYNFEFTPKPNVGAQYPKHQNKLCHGYNLSKYPKLDYINLEWLIEFYNANKKYNVKAPFFKPFFTKLAGTKTLQQQIEQGLDAKTIRDGWKTAIEDYKKMRTPYLLYPNL